MAKVHYRRIQPKVSMFTYVYCGLSDYLPSSAYDKLNHFVIVHDKYIKGFCNTCACHIAGLSNQTKRNTQNEKKHSLRKHKNNPYG